jgi:hypothetical protein
MQSKRSGIICPSQDICCRRTFLFNVDKVCWASPRMIRHDFSVHNASCIKIIKRHLKSSRRGLGRWMGLYSIRFGGSCSDDWEFQWGLTYAPDQNLGHVKMVMSKPPALVETSKIYARGRGRQQSQTDAGVGKSRRIGADYGEVIPISRW